MAFLVLVIDTPDSVTDLNGKIQNSTNPHSAVVNCREYCERILAGCTDASVQVTTRDTDPSVATHGTGSTQVTYNLK